MEPSAAGPYPPPCSLQELPIPPLPPAWSRPPDTGHIYYYYFFFKKEAPNRPEPLTKPGNAILRPFHLGEHDGTAGTLSCQSSWQEEIFLKKKTTKNKKTKSFLTPGPVRIWGCLAPQRPPHGFSSQRAEE
jgi:hypothetical protein